MPPPRYSLDPDDVLGSLVSRWTSEKDVQPRPPAQADEVRTVFERLGSVATSDVIALYTAIGGMDGCCDEGWRFWPLDEVTAQKPSEHGVLFADWMCASLEYRLVPSAGSCSGVQVDGRQGRIGPTLEAFLSSLEADPEYWLY